jgi:F-type H+-transporting ATPase subunit b
VTRARWGRAAALALMTTVTGWSLWAYAQQPAPHPAAVAAKSAEGQGEGAGAPKEGGEAEEGPKPMNWTEFGGETPPFIAMLINFGILVGGYYFLGRKPIAAGLQSRRDTIAKEIDEAQQMKHEAEARAKTYQTKLEKLEEEMKSAREAILRAGEAERERIVREAEAKAERMRKDAEFMVEQELKQIRVDLWRDAVETAVAAAETILTQRVTPADQERLAEAYLADLAGPKGRASSNGSAS